MKKRLLALILCLAMLLSLMLTGCNGNNSTDGSGNGENDGKDQGNTNDPFGDNEVTDGSNKDIGAYGKSLEKLGAMQGYFNGRAGDIKIKCVSGTAGCYKVEGNVITFTSVKADSVYSISGKFSGSIVIDVGDAYKFDLELSGLSMVSSDTNPITVLSGNEVSIKAQKDTSNYIYDTRSAVAENDTASYSGAIHSEVDLEIGGKGTLFVVSSNNNGIHSKNDLQVQNLSLTVSCRDNALKGNDSVQLDSADLTLIATSGDAIKTSKSDISSKGNQRGTISFASGRYMLYAAGEGVDAAYNVTVETGVSLAVYTDKYSIHTESIANTDYSTKGIKAANEVIISGGTIEIKSSDNAIHVNNDTPLENGATGLGRLTVSGGEISIYTRGEGLHADGGLAINGGKTLIISNSDASSAINAKNGYTYTAGCVVAIMPQCEAVGMATNCTGFDGIGKQLSLSLVKGDYLGCVIGGNKLTLNIPVDMTAYVVLLGSNVLSAASPTSSSHSLAVGGYIWEQK